MLVEDMAVVMAEIAVAMPCTVAGMPRQAMLGADTLAMPEADTLVLLFAAGVASILRGMRAAMRAMPGAQVTGAAVVTGEVITDIRTMDTPSPAWAITDWVTAIRIMGMAITDIVPGGTILTGTDTRPT
jgi:hypothetical protein